MILIKGDGQEDTTWMGRGACKGEDAEVFFVEQGESAAPAKRVCMGCEVQEECLDYSLRHGERFGIWGGKSEKERRRLRRKLRVVRTP